MPLLAADIFRRLSEWPHRGAGSEDEMMAREMLTTELVGEPGVDVAEEGLRAPATYLPLFAMIALGQAAALTVAIWAPYVAVMVGIFFLGSHLLFFDWRVSPLIWMGPKQLTANLVAKKGAGRRLFILMAHLDSAPASYAYRADQVQHFKASVYAGTGIVALGVLVPFLDTLGLVTPVWLRLLLVATIMSQPIIAGLDFWRFGYTPGANDNLSGVAAATAAASQLWRRMPDDCEVRLVITTAEEAGMLGAQHYARAHEDELRARQTHIINFDTVGNNNLKYIRKSGGFTDVRYEGPLLDAANALCRQSKKYNFFSAGEHHVGDFDSVWFVRAGISTLTLASYDDDGMMPHIHTPDDTADHVDLDQVARSALFGEALVRTLPKGV
jgi:Peptidase family M28